MTDIIVNLTIDSGTTVNYELSGVPGAGVPVGGSLGSYLRKKSNSDYDTEWIASAAGAVEESNLAFTDTITANATAALHGLLPKLGGTSTVFLNGNGGWSSVSVTAPNVAWGAISGTISNQTDLINRITPVASATSSGKILYNTGTTTYWASQTAVTGFETTIASGTSGFWNYQKTFTALSITPAGIGAESTIASGTSGFWNYQKTFTAVTGFETTIASGTSGFWNYQKTFTALSITGTGSITVIAPMSITGSTNFILGSITISMQAGSATANGYITSADWGTFNGKEPAIASGTAGYWAYTKTFTAISFPVTSVNGQTGVVSISAGAGSVAWGAISGTISNQTDLINRISPPVTTTVAGMILFNTGSTTYWASATAVSGTTSLVQWGNVSGTIANQTDLINRITPVLSATVSGMILYNTGTANYWASQTAVTGFEPTIASGTTGQFYSWTKGWLALSHPVTSVNGQSGVVSLAVGEPVIASGTAGFWNYQKTFTAVTGFEPTIASGTSGYWAYTKTFTAISFPVTSVNGQTGVVSIAAAAGVAWGAISGTIGNQTDLINRITPSPTSTVSGMLLFNTGTTTYWASATAVSGTTSLVQWGNISGTISNQTDLTPRIIPGPTTTVSGMIIYNTGTTSFWASQTAVTGFEATIASGTSGFWNYQKTFTAVTGFEPTIASGTSGYWAYTKTFTALSFPVTSVNGQTGVVSLAVGEPAIASGTSGFWNYQKTFTAVTGFEPTIASGTSGFWSYQKTFTAAPVTSVNGQTGVVSISTAGGGIVWGVISGTIANQLDLVNKIPTEPSITVSGYHIVTTGTSSYWMADTKAIQFGIDNGTTDITAGVKNKKLVVPWACTVLNWYLTADTTGSCAIDVLLSGASMIGAGGTKPNLASAVRSNQSITAWSFTAIPKYGELTFQIMSATSIHSLDLLLEVRLT